MDTGNTGINFPMRNLNLNEVRYLYALWWSEEIESGMEYCTVDEERL